MRQPSSRQNFILVATLSLSGIVACAPTRNSFDPAKNETGHTRVVRDTDTKKPVRAPYTISGSKASFARLAKEVGNRSDTLLAQSVIDTEVQKQGAKLNIRVRFEQTSLSTPSEINLVALMKPSNGGLRSTEVIQALPDSPRFTALVFCPQTDCKRVEIRLQKQMQSSGGKPGISAKNEVGILVTKATPVVQLMRRRSSLPYVSSSLRALEASLPASRAGTVRAEQKSVVVVEGPSFAKVWLGRAPTSQPAFYLIAELFDTSMVVSDIKFAQINGKTVRGRLVGNDPSHGDIMVEIVDGDEAAMLQIEKDKTDIDPEDASVDDIAETEVATGPALEPGKAIFQAKGNDPKVKAASATFAGYRSHPETQKQIEWVLKNDPRGLRGVFTHAPNVSPIISTVLESLKVTPEFAYVLPVESNYLKTGTFNATQVTEVEPSARNRNPSAFGPWQIVNATAIDLAKRSGQNFYIHFIRNKKWDTNDDRGYLVQSTYLAGTYMNMLLNLFSHDQSLAILAYHAGEGAVGSGLSQTKAKMQKALASRLQTISRSDISLSLVSRYKMVDQESLEYAFRVLAWREIGQNPTKYGFGNIQPIRSDAFKKRLSRPNGPVPPALRNVRLI